MANEQNLILFDQRSKRNKWSGNRKRVNNMGCHSKGSRTYSTKGRRGSSSSYKITADSHKSDLRGIELSQEQIYDINQKRIQYQNDLDDSVNEYRSKNADDSGYLPKQPKLKYEHQNAYNEALENDNYKALSRLSYKTLSQLKEKAKRDYYEEQNLLNSILKRNGVMVGTGGRDQGGEAIAKYDKQFKKYSKVIDNINSIMQKKAENYVKKRSNWAVNKKWGECGKWAYLADYNV